MSEWQPIETAPKDKRDAIVGWWSADEWVSVTGEFFPEDEDDPAIWTFRPYGGVGGFSIIHPTHYLKDAPEPPKCK